jgi:tRNA nucleotidyltransferase (CCA-adding enzyme)
VLSALHPRLRLQAPLVGRALELLPSGDGRPDLLVLASLLFPLVPSVEEDPGGQARALIDRWQFHSADRDRVVAAAVTSARLVSELPAIETVSELHAVANGAPLEGVALAGAIGGPECARAAERWLLQTRNVRLAITGEDLLGAGVPQGPEIGRRLDAALALLLDGRLDDTRDAQLLAALEARV